MIISPDKFLDRKNIPLTIDNHTIMSVPSVELLGTDLDDTTK